MGARKVGTFSPAVKSGNGFLHNQSANHFGNLPASQSTAKKEPVAIAPDEDEWFEDREQLHSKSQAAEGDGESIWLLSYADMMTLLFGFFVMISSFSKLDTKNFDRVRLEATQLFGGEFSRALNPSEKLNDDFSDSGITEKAYLHDEEKGAVSITFRGSVFFENASAEVRQEAQEMLDKVIQSIKRQPTRFKVVVEGHTDNKPVTSGKFPSNWELSSLRASAVLRVFESNGFDRAQLSAIGYADSRPLLPNTDSSGRPLVENQNQNRRVVIKLIRASEKN